MTMGKHVRRIAVGYCLLYLHVKFNGWDLLPNFVGWALFYRAIPALREERPKVLLLKHFALVLGLWAAVSWIPISPVEILELSWLPGVGLPGLVIQMMTLYFHFQFLTELAELAGAYQQRMARQDHREKLLRARTGVTVLQTASVLLAAVPYQRLPWEMGEWAETGLVFGLLLFTLVFCVTILRELFSLAGELDRLGQESAEN